MPKKEPALPGAFSKRALLWYGAVGLGTAAAYRLMGRLPRPVAHGRRLRLGTNVWLGYEPLYLSRDLGFIQPQQTRLIEYASASQVLQAFKNGTIDAAALTLDELVTLKQYGIPARVVLVTDFSNGADALVASPDIETLAGLRGRTIGVESGALGAYMLSRALSRADLGLSDVRVANLEVDEHERAYASGEVDAVITFDPTRRRLLRLGARSLFDSSMIPEEVVDVLAVHQSALDSRPEAVDRTIDGWFRALDFMTQSPQDAARMMSGRLKLEPAELAAAFAAVDLPTARENRSLLAGGPDGLQATARRLAKVMADNDSLHREVDLSSLVDPAPLLRHLGRSEAGGAP